MIGTIRNHLDGICNIILIRTTSGVMEEINNRIKLIKRQAYGFMNFNNFRTRLLAASLIRFAYHLISRRAENKFNFSNSFERLIVVE
ncbi:transposase (plasmid) [Gloeocapsopsis dulcis]|uniref:transposase n=1 Tax=Gloeocapsopsis dulcis TaxID=2859516 RepID=UPI0019D5AF3C|nr:transposase [Gloeocapsopsis dulcis]